MHTVVVTGGAGFIGSNFVHYTRAHRPDVRVVVLDALTYAGNLESLKPDFSTDVRGVAPTSIGLGEAVASSELSARSAAASCHRASSPTSDLVCELVVGDICDHALVDELVASADQVVHFAAESHNDNSLQDPAPFLRANVEGTVTVASACVKHGVPLHHISTDEVFGDLPVGSPERFTESTPYRPSSPYSASKAAADHMVRAWVRSFGLKATMSNCSNNYGPRQHPEKFIPRQIIGLIEGRRPRVYGTGENVRDWIHVDDHNSAVWSIIDAACQDPALYGRTFLIGADGERSNLDIVGDLLEAFGLSRSDYVHVTDRPGHDRRYAIDPTTLRTELRWEPTHSLADGLRETIEWYRNNRDWWEVAAKAAEAKYALTEKELP
ncbi:dTDP-glucose 4,6-dehydratase [Corynebacterium kroppenstedtii]|uniref:dTDP-glucose 4,6-dehydratase n=1 Tax=Corynebacterium sp. PCR 32 TaxID=3351342 RepID=UPI0030A180E2